jgi:hypothetical protein
MNECRIYRERLADAAEGRGDAEVILHIEGCAKCSELVRRYRQIFEAARHPWESAPAEQIAMAKSLIPSQRRLVIARRLGTSQLAGARGERDEFQILVGTESLSLRLMASREDGGWHLMGRFPQGEYSPGDWTIESVHRNWTEEEGFHIVVPSLTDCEFSLVGPDLTLQVPSLGALF